MAQSRLERIGTIFSRVSSLMKGGAVKPEDKPLWYEIYEAFPPKVEPRYDRPAPKMSIRKIFYKEDLIRAKFQKENPKILACTLAHEGESRTQQFIKIYQDLEKNGVPEESLYAKAMENYLARNQVIRDQMAKNEHVQEQTRDEKQFVESEKKSSVNLKNIFEQES